MAILVELREEHGEFETHSTRPNWLRQVAQHLRDASRTEGTVRTGGAGAPTTKKCSLMSAPREERGESSRAEVSTSLMLHAGCASRIFRGRESLFQ